MPPHLRPVLRELEAGLRSAFRARLHDLQLFGSYARGEATEDSDVDVPVLVDGLTPSEIAVVSAWRTTSARSMQTPDVVARALDDAVAFVDKARGCLRARGTAV